MHSESLETLPGSVSQVREVAARLVQRAKQLGTVLILVGHVTKEGNIAGPRVLEHMIDTFLMLGGKITVDFGCCVQSRIGLAPLMSWASLR